jgi:hypothetical protein
LVVYVQPNTVYVLKTQINVEAVYSQQAQLSVATPYYSTGTPPAQTFPLSMGLNDFAYAFVSNSTGQIDVVLRSPDAIWAFESCEITSAAF